MTEIWSESEGLLGSVSTIKVEHMTAVKCEVKSKSSNQSVNRFYRISPSVTAAARAVAANYGWFIGMLLSGLVFIGIVVFIYWIHRKRRDVEEKPRTRSGGEEYIWNNFI